jgi:uncharacterized integral membrane protein
LLLCGEILHNHQRPEKSFTRALKLYNINFIYSCKEELKAMRNFFNTIFFALLVLFFVTFALSNSQTISLNFFGSHLRPIPVSLLILVPFLVGIILGSFLDIVERFSMRREVKKLRKELKEREIQSHEVATRGV